MSDTTTSDEVRWKYLASIVTALLVSSLIVLVIGSAIGVLSVGAITQAWFVLYATAVISSVAWVYGEDFVDWRNNDETS